MSKPITSTYDDEDEESSQLSELSEDEEHNEDEEGDDDSEEENSEASVNDYEDQDGWPSEGKYYPSQDDILKAQDILHTLLPMELVSLILDAADYGQCHLDYNWRATSIPVRYMVIVGQLLDALPWQFLVTTRIGFYQGDGSFSEKVKVKKVVFWMRSRTYSDDKTSFEASIYRRMRYSGRGSKVEALRRIVEARTSAPDKEDLEAARIELVRNDANGQYAWPIQCNLEPTDDMVDHKVEWTAKDELTSDDEAQGRDVISHCHTSVSILFFFCYTCANVLFSYRMLLIYMCTGNTSLTMGNYTSSYFNRDEEEEDCWIDGHDDSIPEYLGNSDHPSVEDVLETRNILLAFMPLELVNIILEEARYWRRVVCCNYEAHTLHTEHGNMEPRWQYLITPPIPSPPKNEDGEEMHMKIREVEFWIRSCDQGWGGDHDLTGLYDGSWTWFEASIYRRLPGDVPEYLRFGIERNNIPAPDKETLEAARIERVTNHTDGAIHGICKGMSALHQQLSCIRFFGLRKVECVRMIHLSTIGNRSRIRRGIVSSLRAGDRIAIISRARFPGWANNVHEAAVDVYYSI
ncbi:hypothetical protein BDQ17DRAFT_1459983 [Cyathus striatus]|nr:hypothetical protein BDQ17DRAFT_1459983 [Cyathus striatus]